MYPMSGANVARCDLQVLPGYPAGVRTWTFHEDLDPPAAPRIRIGDTIHTGETSGQTVTFTLPDLTTSISLVWVMYDETGDAEAAADNAPVMAGEVVRWAQGAGPSLPTALTVSPGPGGAVLVRTPTPGSTGGPRRVEIRQAAGNPAVFDLSDLSPAIATVVLETATAGARVSVTALPAPGSRGPLYIQARNGSGGVVPSMEIAGAGPNGLGVLIAGIAGQVQARLDTTATAPDGDPVWRAAMPNHHIVGHLAGDVDMSEGDWTDLPLAGGGTIDRDDLVGTSVAVVDGDDMGIWVVTATGPCRSGQGLTGGDIVSTPTGELGVATDDNGTPPSPESITVIGTAATTADPVTAPGGETTTIGPDDAGRWPARVWIPPAASSVDEEDRSKVIIDATTTPPPDGHTIRLTQLPGHYRMGPSIGVDVGEDPTPGLLDLFGWLVAMAGLSYPLVLTDWEPVIEVDGVDAGVSISGTFADGNAVAAALAGAVGDTTLAYPVDSVVQRRTLQVALVTDSTGTGSTIEVVDAGAGDPALLSSIVATPNPDGGPSVPGLDSPLLGISRTFDGLGSIDGRDKTHGWPDGTSDPDWGHHDTGAELGVQHCAFTWNADEELWTWDGRALRSELVPFTPSTPGDWPDGTENAWDAIEALRDDI